MSSVASGFDLRWKRAIIYALLSSLAFAAMLATSKACLSQCSMNQVSFFKGAFSWILITGFLVKKRGVKDTVRFLQTKHFSVHCIRGFSGVVTIYLFLTALKSISLASANLLFNSTPLFVPWIAYVWKKESIRKGIWPGLILAFFGMALLLHPAGTEYTIGLWIALTAGAVGAVTTVAVRASHATEPVERTIFYYGGFSCLCSGLLYAVEGASGFTPGILLSLIGIGIASFLCQVFFTLAFKYAPSGFLSPFFYTSTVFGILWDYLADSRIPSFEEASGMLLVTIGLCYISFLLANKRSASPLSSDTL